MMQIRQAVIVDMSMIMQLEVMRYPNRPKHVRVMPIHRIIYLPHFQTIKLCGCFFFTMLIFFKKNICMQRKCSYICSPFLATS